MMRRWRPSTVVPSGYDLLRLPRTPQTTSYATGDAAQVNSGNPDVENRWTLSGNLATDNHTGLQWVRNAGIIVPGSATGAIVQRAMGTYNDSTRYLVGDLVAYTPEATTLYYVCLTEHGNPEAAVQPGTSPTTWAQTVWTASAADLTTPATMTWENALAACLALNYGGHGGWSAENPTGWRLPTALELLSLLNLSNNPLVDTTVFAAWPSGTNYYKGSDTPAYNDARSKALTTNSMSIGDRDKTEASLVLPVRSIY